MFHKVIVALVAAVIAVTLTVGQYSPANAQASCTQNHLVQRGDTLYRLSQRYGVSVAELQRFNGMASSTVIYVGQSLCVKLTGLPPSTPTPLPPVGTTYIVQKGDTLASIARRYGVSWRVVANLNKLANPNLIYAGQALIIPDFTTQ